MKKSIKILGTGCTKCKQTTDIIKEIVDKYNVEATIDKVEDIMEIMSYDVLSTPAIVINGEIKVQGRVPSKKEVEDLLVFVSDDPNGTQGRAGLWA